MTEREVVRNKTQGDEVGDLIPLIIFRQPKNAALKVSSTALNSPLEVKPNTTVLRRKV